MKKNKNYTIDLDSEVDKAIKNDTLKVTLEDGREMDVEQVEVNERKFNVATIKL